MQDKHELKHRFKNVNGLDWHWVEMGSGHPVVLLHGIPESWACWHHQIPTLSQQHRVIALDLKGYGQSGKPDGDYSGTTVASEVLSLLDEIDIDIDLDNENQNDEFELEFIFNKQKKKISRRKKSN